MREMKDSGIGWIGEIPSMWETIKLDYASDEITDYTANGSFADLAANVKYLDNEDYAMLVRTADLSAKREIENIYIDKHAYDFLKKAQLFGGEIILSNIGSVGSVYYYQPLYEKSALAPNAIMIRAYDKGKYLYYLFSTNQAKECLLQLSNATTQAKFNKTQLRGIRICLPPEDEQQLIASFLDTKCSQIDNLSKKIQEEIDILEEYKRSVITEAVTKGLDPDVEMKDSGIGWIGNIPVDWKLDKGKYIFEYLEKSVREDDGVITCFRDGEVTLRSNRRTEGFTESLQEIGYQGIDVGDLIVHGMDGFAGSIGISDSRGKASPVLNNLGTKQNKRYYMYFLRMMAWKGVFISLATGIRVRTCDTNWGKLRTITYLLPPIDEQNNIANYLDQKCSQIDESIEKKQQQLSTLEEYKRSLIYEYVTGKKEVPND